MLRARQRRLGVTLQRVRRPAQAQIHQPHRGVFQSASHLVVFYGLLVPLEPMALASALIAKCRKERSFKLITDSPCSASQTFKKPSMPPETKSLLSCNLKASLRVNSLGGRSCGSQAKPSTESLCPTTASTVPPTLRAFFCKVHLQAEPLDHPAHFKPLPPFHSGLGRSKRHLQSGDLRDRHRAIPAAREHLGDSRAKPLKAPHDPLPVLRSDASDARRVGLSAPQQRDLLGIPRLPSHWFTSALSSDVELGEHRS